jgi:hypothetical protein
MVVTLEQRGLIQRTPFTSRSIRVLLPPEALPNLETGLAPLQQVAFFESTYPHVAQWIMDGGWVELGRTEGSTSMARALDEGDMFWEGKESYASMDELLRDLDAGIAQVDRG